MPVYKDDCVYCFDTPESPYGLDVCLSCQIATSPHPNHNFTALHFAQTGHGAYANIVRAPRQRQNKQLRLAVDSQTDEDLYETTVTVRDHTGAKLDEQLHQAALAEVLKADSYSKVAEVEAWELQVFECKHVSELVQSPSSGEHNLSSCAACELNSNLWLCLTCGRLGCGRQQFGGGGGNGHGLEHFNESCHPVAVKLGTITAQGKADVFCYICDEEVRDQNLAVHLAHWGIEISSAQKTEKSLTELQLEQNAKFDFSMDDGHGHELEPVLGPGLTGMRNLGNTCYLNSVVQVLFSLLQFQQAFPANTVDNVGGFNDPPNNLTIQLRKLRDALDSGEYAVRDPHSQVGHQRGIAPSMLKHLIGRGHAEFAGMQQQDAFEFLSHLLTRLKQEAAQAGTIDPTAAFCFQQERRMQCTKCNAILYKQSVEESISVQVPINRSKEDPSGYTPVSIAELLKINFADEQLEFQCPRCKETTKAESQVGLETFPEVLALNVRRFEIINWVPRKVDVPVTLEEPVVLDGFQNTNWHSSDEDLLEEQVSFQADPEALTTLESMGFTVEKSVQALEATNNNLEAAMEWIFSPESETAPSTSQGVSEEALATLGAMGFSEQDSLAALKANGSIDAAVEWLFNGNAGAAQNSLPVNDNSDAPPPGTTSTPAHYKLHGIVCHKGTSVHAGHYVACVKKNNEWYLFNDEKVVKLADMSEIQRHAYLYIFCKA